MLRAFFRAMNASQEAITNSFIEDRDTIAPFLIEAKRLYQDYQSRRQERQERLVAAYAPFFEEGEE